MSAHINSTIIAAALGATVAVVAAAASIIYNNIQRRNEQQQEHTTMQSKIQNLNQIVANLKEEVDQLLEWVHIWKTIFSIFLKLVFRHNQFYEFWINYLWIVFVVWL